MYITYSFTTTTAVPRWQKRDVVGNTKLNRRSNQASRATPGFSRHVKTSMRPTLVQYEVATDAVGFPLLLLLLLLFACLTTRLTGLPVRLTKAIVGLLVSMSLYYWPLLASLTRCRRRSVSHIFTPASVCFFRSPCPDPGPLSGPLAFLFQSNIGCLSIAVSSEHGVAFGVVIDADARVRDR